MRIQYLNGGLANQVFQYIFVRYAELLNPQEEPWLFDDSFFFVNNVHNGYELKKVFNIDANLLSRNFDEDVWREFIRNKKNGISVPQSFKNLGFDIQMIAEFENYKDHSPFDGVVHRIPGNEFCPEITRIPGTVVYYHGYWLNFDWFAAYRDIFLRELTFPPIEDERNMDYAHQIMDSDSVAVHIRRGDYVTIGWTSKNEYYLNTTRSILTDRPDATFFIFSDDIPWCREHSHDLGFDLPVRTVFVEGNTDGKNYIDMQLMSICKGMVMSKSAFCYLALILNRRLEFCCDDEPRK